jgi:hypothetical protein
MVDGCWLMVVRRRFFFASLIRMTHIEREERRKGEKEKGRISTNFNFTNSTTSTNSTNKSLEGYICD